MNEMIRKQVAQEVGHWGNLNLSSSEIIRCGAATGDLTNMNVSEFRKVDGDSEQNGFVTTFKLADPMGVESL